MLIVALLDIAKSRDFFTDVTNRELITRAQECELRLEKSFEEDRLSGRFSQLQGAVDDIADSLSPFRDMRAKFEALLASATASDLSKKPPHKGTKAAVRDSKGQLITATTKARVGRRKIKKLPGAAAGGGKVV